MLGRILGPGFCSTPFLPSLFSSLFSEKFWWSMCSLYWWLLCGPTCRGSQQFHPYWTGAPAPERPALPGEQSPFPPLSRGAQAGGLAPEKDRLLALGLPEPVVASIQHARAPSTRAAYSYRWQVFTTWCVSHQVAPYLASAQEILRFLQSQLEAQKAAVTLRGLVAARQCASGNLH